jgi:flagellar hook-length control protein FliK
MTETMEVCMALPLLNMLSLASGAVNVVQKALSQGNAKGGSFDAELSSALNGKTGSGNPLSKILQKGGKISDEELKSLLGTPAGFLLFQFMTSLKEMGLSSSDIKLLLNGNGSQISDDALKTLLTQNGINGNDLESILANTELKNEIKTSLGDSFKSIIEAQAKRDGIDPASLLELAASDSGSIDEILAKLESVKALDKAQAETGQTNQASTVNTNTVAADPVMKLTVGLIQNNASHTTDEIRAMMGQILKKVDKAGLQNAANVESTKGNPEVAASVAGMTKTAQEAMGISRDELKSLFFEAEPAARQELVDQVAAKVNAYLKTQEGKTLSPEVMQALSFLKTAMSKSEFAGIDQSLNLWNAGQAVPDLKMHMDSDMYAALAKNLGSSDAQGQFETQMKQVVDQLRQAIPGQIKDTGGQMTLKLHPPMLGNVDVSMTLADGQLQANFKTDQLITRDMLVQNMSILKEALADQGIKATQFSVSMSFDSRDQQGNAYASWAGFEKGSQGSGRQANGDENGDRSFREEDGAVYAQANYSGLLDRGVDFFA